MEAVKAAAAAAAVAVAASTHYPLIPVSQRSPLNPPASSARPIGSDKNDDTITSIAFRSHGAQLPPLPLPPSPFPDVLARCLEGNTFL